MNQEKVYSFVSLVIAQGAADLVQIATVSDKAIDIARRFYGRLVSGRKAQDIPPAERMAFVKACIAHVRPNVAGDDFKKRLFRCGVLSKVANEMGFPVMESRKGRKGKGKGSVPVVKNIATFKKVVAAMIAAGISQSDIAAAVAAVK